MKYLFTALFTVILHLGVSANHIAGGDFTISHVEGNTFEARLILYRDCEGNLVTDNIITIAAFDVVTNAYLPDISFTMSNPDAEIIPLANSCYDTGLCVESQTYVQLIEIPDNPNGYYFSWERCCRNELAINVNAFQQGMVFTVEVPDPALQNSTPEFVPYPSDAFLCVNEVTSISFAASDIDGDSLVYSLIEPLSGDGTSFAAPTIPQGALPRPYSPLAWTAGYSLADPVGGDPVMAIDTQTGLVTAQPDNIGFYSIAVLVQEYRAGVKIGEVIREAQLAALACVIDLPSEIFTPDDDTIFNVFANTNFCIEIEVTDPNEGDTLFVQADGELFDGSIIPMASYPDADGFSTVIQDLCWAPLCQHVRDEPYIVTLSAFSRGCANVVQVTTKDIYINVILDEDEPTELAEPVAEGVPGVVIDLYDPGTHCFEFVFEDPNEADSIFVVASSPIFDLPNAPTIDPAIDQGVLSLPYCWEVTCADVRDEPYLVDFFVVTTNCEVNDTTTFTVPIQVIVPENEPTIFAQPQEFYSFEFYSADTFCIPVTVLDENFFDTLQVSAVSPIFQLADNPAQFDPLEGTSIVEGQLCWAPKCTDVRDEPYLVTFTATSNSCKTSDVVSYTIEIQLTLPPESAPFFEFPLPDFAVEHFIGDDPIDFTVIARDVDPYDTLTLTATSEAFSVPGSRPTFEPFTNNEVVASDFLWTPACPDVSEEPYIVVFEVNSRSCQKDVSRFLEIPVLVTTPTRGIIDPIPNVITPNGDGRNDRWTIENKDDVCLLNFKTFVYDRWGREVFFSDDPAFEWDALVRDGSKATDGTYFHVIEFLYKDAVKTYSGNVEILGSNAPRQGR